MEPRFVRTPATRPPLHIDARDLGVLVDLGAQPVCRARVGPHHGVVADDAARLVVERAQDRPCHIGRDVDLGAELLHSVSVDDATLDPEQLVDLGSLGRGDHPAVGVGECQVADLREHQVEIELL